MNFISTRGDAPPLSFADVLLGALAPDGGLYMPERWPDLDVAQLAGDYASVATAVLRPFLGGGVGDAETHKLVAAALAGFEHPDIAPLVELEPDLYLLELFHGPTLAFKDVAMQLLAQLISRELDRRKSRATILVATSGDTGAAAIAAFGSLPQVELFVLHPKGRVSEVQRRQMTTAIYPNVHNIALEGTFDHAQALVKTLFADREFADAMSFMAVNSINLVRIIAQSVYYFTATAKLGRSARFVVPTGNFGDIFAGEAASRMGLPVAGLVAATNVNDILTRALGDGIYAVREVQATLSPSMDIQVASNFERALFEACDRDSGWLCSSMTSFARERKLVIPPSVLDALHAYYRADAVSDAVTVETIRDVHLRSGRLIDPHTAVGVAASRRLDRQENTPTVVLSTAHAAKFPETVATATGLVPPLPRRLGQSYVGTERQTVLPADAQCVRTFIETRTANHER